jgi:hypothetical protein
MIMSDLECCDRLAIAECLLMTMMMIDGSNNDDRDHLRHGPHGGVYGVSE